MPTEIPIWPGSSSFTTGSTPFGFYDTDTAFQVDVDKVSDWCARRLGYPLLDVELQAGNFYSFFEEAISEYSNHVNQYNIQQNLLSIIGSSTGSNLTHRNISSNLGGMIQLATEYGSETFTNGNIPFYSQSIAVSVGTQKYNLNTLIRDVSAPSQSIEIKRVHHYAPAASARIYDPYLGNQGMIADAYGLGGTAIGTSYMMMPMYADLLRMQAIEFTDMMRKSSYSFELINNELRIFPIPVFNFNLWIEYIIKEDRINPLKYPDGTVSDMSNAPYDRMQYTFINSVGRQWIFRYTLALSKETLGFIRGKYSSIPIPNSEVTLNAADLLSSAQAEKTQLIEELRTMLETTTRQKLLEAKKDETDNLNGSLLGTPLKIYIG